MAGASDLVGKKFVKGGRDPNKGLDCVGLALAVIEKVRPKLLEQFNECTTGWNSKSLSEATETLMRFCDEVKGEVEPGDLLLFKVNFKPVLGVMYDSSRFLYTTMETNRVCSSRKGDLIWNNHLVGVFRGRSTCQAHS